jgi:hypothetical protein
MLSEASYHNMTVGRIPSVEGGIQPTIVDAKGDLIAATGNDSPARLGVGSNGQSLIANSSASTGLQWNTGSILQIVSTTKTDTFVTSSTSFTDVTGISVSITPKFSTSKILILVTINGTSASGQLGFFKLLRDSTDISIGDAASSRTRASFGTFIGNSTQQYTESMGINFLDSPATTSSTTYKLQVRSTSGNICINRSGWDDNFDYFARTASSITVMEVSA